MVGGREHSRGFTLIEAIVACAAVSVALLAAALALVSGRRAYTSNFYQSSLNAEAMRLVEEIANDLKDSGTGGCTIREHSAEYYKIGNYASGAPVYETGTPYSYALAIDSNGGVFINYTRPQSAGSSTGVSIDRTSQRSAAQLEQVAALNKRLGLTGPYALSLSPVLSFERAGQIVSITVTLYEIDYSETRSVNGIQGVPVVWTGSYTTNVHLQY